MQLLNKSYDYALTPEGFILSLVYLALLSGVLVTINKKLDLPFSAKAIVSLYLYYYLFFIFSALMPVVPNFPDTWLFVQMITENYFPMDQGLGVKLFYFTTYPLRILAIFKVETFITIQIFIFMLSLMAIWKSWEIVLRKNSIAPKTGANTFLILSAFYPSFLLFIPQPFREFWVLFGFSIMIYGIVIKYYEDSRLFDRGLLYMVIGSFMLLTARPQLIIIVIIFLALFQTNRWVKYGMIIASIFLIPYLFTALTSLEFNPAFFRNVRNQAFEHFSSSHLTYGYVEWNSYLDILKDLPKLFAQFLLSPLPILHEIKPTKFLAIFADMLYTLVIYFFAFYAGLRVSKLYIFIFLLSAAFFSIWEFHIGGAARHRMPLVMILIPAASYGIVRFYHELKGK